MWKHVSLVLSCAVLSVSHAAAQWSQLDSTEFMYKFEMDLTPDLADVDANGIPDFSVSGGGGIVTDGILYVASGSGTYYNSAGAGQPWPGNFDSATGYTIEFRVKILEDLGSAAGNAMSVTASPIDTNAWAFLGVGAEGQSWSEAGGWLPLGENDNTDDFHVFRVAQKPGVNEYSVWRDGVLIARDLGSGYTYAVDRLLFGDIGGNWDGAYEMDYLRFTPGGYTPVGFEFPAILPPSQTKASEDFDYKYEMDVDPRNQGEIDLDSNWIADWGFLGDEAALTFTGNGTAQIATNPDIPAALFDSGIFDSGNIWPYVGFGGADGFTIETRFKVIEDTGTVGAFDIVVCPSDNSELAVLTVAADGQYWHNADNPVGEAVDNTDDFHTLRLVRTADADGGQWYVYRDGILLNEDGRKEMRPYTRNALYIGDSGGSNQGTVEYDYIRFTAGAYAPEGSSGGLAGDLNGDGLVGSADLDIVRANWGSTVTPGDSSVGDPSGDGIVGSADLDIVRANWGATAAAAVPEPSLLVLLLGGLLTIRRRN